MININNIINTFNPRRICVHINDTVSWITLKNGEHVQVDEHGEVVAGAGGNLNGKKLDVKSKSDNVETPTPKKENFHLPFGDLTSEYDWATHSDRDVYEAANKAAVAVAAENEITSGKGRAKIRSEVMRGKHNGAVQTEFNKIKEGKNQKQTEKPKTVSKYPTSGYIGADDPSVYGRELLGHEGESWANFNSNYFQLKNGINKND